MKSPQLYLLGILCAGTLSSCVSLETAAPPVATITPPNQTSYTHLNSGREIYVGKCTKCHSAEVIVKHSLDDWKGDIMPAMSKKAKLSPSEEASVMAYVNAVIKVSVSAQPKS